MAGIIDTDEEHAEALAALDCLLDLDPQLLAGREALPQVDGCREGGQLSLETRDVVELDDALTVGGVGELQPARVSFVMAQDSLTRAAPPPRDQSWPRAIVTLILSW